MPSAPQSSESTATPTSGSQTPPSNNGASDTQPSTNGSPQLQSVNIKKGEPMVDIDIDSKSIFPTPTLSTANVDLDVKLAPPVKDPVKAVTVEKEAYVPVLSPPRETALSGVRPGDCRLNNGPNDSTALITIPDKPVVLERPSVVTVELAAAAKIFLEIHYNELLRGPTPRALRAYHVETQLVNARNLTSGGRQAYLEAFYRAESFHLRENRILKARSTRSLLLDEGNGPSLLHASICAANFEMLKILGKGSFGTVRLVREKPTAFDSPAVVKEKRKQVYAMKVIRKSEMIRSGQEGHVRAERDFLVSSEGSNWAVPLIASFQDVANLYLVMEYMPGGDFLGLLIRENILDEAVTRFYIAEMILCVEEAHALQFIHRDIKPDNFLISASGHLKISDFGLAFDGHWSHDSKYYSSTRYSLLQNLGIYVPGDELDRQKDESVGRPGTMSQRLCSKRYRLKDTAISELERLDSRDGSTVMTDNGSTTSRDGFGLAAGRSIARQYVFPYDAEDIKAHKFFKGLPWERLYMMPPPFVPKLRTEDDTQYFDDSFKSDTDGSSESASEADKNEAARAPSPPPKDDDFMEKDYAAKNKKEMADRIDEALQGFDVNIQMRALTWVATPFDSSRLKAIEAEIGQLVALGLPMADGEALIRFVAKFGKKERKRPRDRLLRNAKTKKISMELRKRNAFLGYTWRRMNPHTTLANYDRNEEGSLAVMRSTHRGCF
ncbi:AGC/NDR/NDR protein kinase [Sporothrix schenckii ATCC 58251]|uniref:non-specific serine/threonine protein kinase n=1 Tax=Sporothrix schenckii (strain ATCC 58251 / de Perez 2211183) TaxID=1391915 RepID=U7Q5I6_SPOS1|nr:AGC/NDR/NDR protein kinase [Sporothrix schenckii ATCC 58251]